MSYHQHRRFLGSMPSLDRMISDMRQFAEWGYRPLFFDINTMPANVSAAPSWEDSLPRAIVASDPIIQAIKRGRRPSEAGVGNQQTAGSSAGSNNEAQQRPTPAPRQPRAGAVRRGPSFIVRSAARPEGEAAGSTQVSNPSAPTQTRPSQRNRPRR
jgi:hypothetical protein